MILTLQVDSSGQGPEMKIPHMSRRYFLKNISYSVLASRLDLIGESIPFDGKKPLIVRVHDAGASRPWDYHRSRPWDHTVEPGSLEDIRNSRFRSDRYYDHIDETVVASMVRRGLTELTGTGSTKEAWGHLLTDYKKTDRLTIKINLNNASYSEEITTNRMDQTIPLINAVIADLVENRLFAEKNITVADPSRWIHPLLLKNRCRFRNINWVDSRSSDLWDHSETVEFTIDKPVRPPGDKFPESVPFYLANAYTKTDHIINLCLLKNHGCGITGAMKNHFGAIPPPSPKYLHDGLGEKGYIADLCNTNSIKNKVRINICDAIFANWHNNVWAPRPWKTFPKESPNSLFFGTDPVAFDSVLLQHITDEVNVQGDNAPKWVREGIERHQFLHHAMEYHRLGIHEHKPFGKIEYREISIF